MGVATARSPLNRLRRTCLALPGAWEVSHGEPTFWVGKRMFASFADKGNHHGAGRDAVWCKATHATQDLLIARRLNATSHRHTPAPAAGSAYTSTSRLIGLTNSSGFSMRMNWLRRPRALGGKARRGGLAAGDRRRTHFGSLASTSKTIR